MTPFEAKGWTKDMKFVVTPNEDRWQCHKKGTIVWLKEDDDTVCPAFTDGTDWFYYDFWELDPVVNEETDRSNAEVNKDTIFNLKLTGEELVYLAVSLGKMRSGNDLVDDLDNSVYLEVASVLKNFSDSSCWIDCDLGDIQRATAAVFPPQETPEQKQYKELLAQREALDVELAQLSQKLNLKERIGGV